MNIFRLLAAGLLAALAHTASAQQFGIGNTPGQSPQFGPGAPQTTAPRPIIELDRIVAIVNDDVIVESELEGRVRAIHAELEHSGTRPPSLDLLRRQVLERLILDRLQIQIAERTGMRIDDETLNESVASIARENGLTLRQFRDILEADGFDFARFREDIRNELVVARVQQREVLARVQVSERDIENYLATVEQQGRTDAEYRLAHILVAVPEGASPEEIAAAAERATQVHTALRQGMDFGRAAVAHSDGRHALEAGDLGWRDDASLPGLFAEAVRELEIGEVSDVIRSPSGFHIVRLSDRRGGGRYVVDQTRVRHILIRPSELISDDVARTRLEQLRMRIQGGDDFGELARAHSDDTASAVNGGDLGWLAPGDVVSEFQEMMDRTRPGELSPPFRTQFGWHLLEVQGRRQHDDTEQVRRARAAEELRRRKVDDELQTWLRQIRDEAYVELRLEE